MKKEYKLTFELVPDGCWYTNLRSALPSALWDKIRRNAYAKADGKCSICFRKTARLEAHEVWSYNETEGVQKLEGVVALCKNCHEVKHIARTQLVGRGDEAMEWFMRVNDCSQSQFHLALQEANETYKRRNKINWNTDISWLEKNL